MRNIRVAGTHLPLAPLGTPAARRERRWPPAHVWSGGQAHEWATRQDEDTAPEGTGIRGLPANRDLTAPALVLEAAVAPLVGGTEPETDPFGTVIPDTLQGSALSFLLRLESLVAARIDLDERHVIQAFANLPALPGIIHLLYP